MENKKFKVTRNENGDVAGIEFNAEAFIIPNHAGKLEDFWFDSVRTEAKKQAARVLGHEPKENDWFVQLWYVAKDLNCENLVDHNAYVDIDGKNYVIRMDSCFLPYEILKDKDDGDTVDVYFTNGRRDWDDEDEKPSQIEIVMHVTLNQHDYRYRNFGTFQQVLNKVTR